MFVDNIVDNDNNNIYLKSNIQMYGDSSSVD